MRVHKGMAVLAATVVVALGLAACTSSKSGGGSSSSSSAAQAGFGSCATSPNTCNSGTVKPGGTMTYTIEKTISGWNLNNADSNTFDFQEVLDGVLPSAFLNTPDVVPYLNSDLLSSATQTSANPQTLVYQIKPTAVWSDGTPITADDFIYSWQTQDGTHCPDCAAASTAGYSQIKSVIGSNNGQTVTVVMSTPFFDWKTMFGNLYPAHIASQHGDLAASFTWFDANQPTYSAGPYIITGYSKDTSVTETPNPKWYGATKPGLSKLVFRIITDQTQEVPALQNNEVQAIYPQPDQDIVSQAKSTPGVITNLGAGMQWEHLDFNLANPILADTKLRTALFTAVDRNQIIAKTVGQFAPNIKPLNNRMYMPTQPGYQDNVTASGQGSGNVDKAKSILTAAGYTGVGTKLKNPAGKDVSIRCSFTSGNTLRQQTCQLLQSELAALGVTVTPTPVQSLGKTLGDGDFDMIIYAWVGTPFAVAGAQQIWTTTGGSDFGKNNDPQVDALLNGAAGQTDQTVATADLNKADVLLNGDAYSLPLFQKPTFLAIYGNYVNVRDNPTQLGPPYNVAAWGVKAS